MGLAYAAAVVDQEVAPQEVLQVRTSRNIFVVSYTTTVGMAFNTIVGCLWRLGLDVRKIGKIS
ncbi:hypothetical protein WG66_003356 [Moniliophthora roreri]|nr:hypothetical protein WG66_007478 [Moniliophthora roreri]KAI3616419.1 hypothetical protein WG66_003356 [Moniliophthora roreri]